MYVKEHTNVRYTLHIRLLVYCVQILLAEHVDANILNVSGATPLHMTRDPEIIRVSPCPAVVLIIIYVLLSPHWMLAQPNSH